MEAEFGRGNRRNQPRCSKKSLCMLAAVLAIAAVVVGGIQYSLHKYVKNNSDGTILKGTTIAGVDVSGMKKSEAKKAVEAQVQEFGGKKVRFNVQKLKTVEVTLDDLGLAVDNLDEALQEAVDYGKSENLTEAYKTIKRAKKGKNKYEVRLSYSLKKKELTNILDNETKSDLEQPENASVTQKDGKIVTVPGKRGELPDVDAAYKALKKQLDDNWNGAGLDVEVKILERNPEVTEADLKGMTDLLGTFTTTYGTDDPNRVMNVESGAKHIGNVLLEPGETMSANDAMEPYTEENGYAMAGSYESNRVVESMGGGICQVSTTLYNALLYAELEIVERYPHSMPVSYVEPSRDAAIADNLMDFVFKNNQKDPVFIETIVGDGTLTFNIYGKETRPEGRTFEYVSSSEQKEAPTEVRYVADDSSYIGSINYESPAQPEINARLDKIIYQDGEEQSTENVNYSTYQSSPETYGVGTYSDNPADTQKMNAAIASQDEATIQNAINEILYQ